MKEQIIVIHVDTITLLCDQCDYEITMRGHMNSHTRFDSDGKHSSGMPLPWVQHADHLGHVLHEDGSMRHDALQKRGKFIDSSSKVMKTFEFAYPD